MLPGKTYSAEDILNIVSRRLWLLPLPLVALFVALIISSRLPDIYQSEMLIAIVPQRVPNDFVRSTVTLRTEERLDAITVQIKSRSVLEPMITEFDLYHDQRARIPMEDIVQKMRDDIEVRLEVPRPTQREADPSAFHVRFKYPDAALAARVAQRLGTTYVDQNTRDRGALAKATDEFLDLQLSEARVKLEAQEKLVEAFREKHGSELPTQYQTNLSAIQSLQMQIQALIEATARDRDRKLMLERLYQDAQSEPTPAVAPPAAATMQTAAGPLLPTAPPQQQLAAAQTLLTNLQMRLTPEHPDIGRTKRLIAELETKVAALEAADHAGDAATTTTTPEEAQRRERLRGMRAEIESLDRQMQFKESEERRLRNAVNEYQRRIEAVPGVESQWVVLTRDYDTQIAAYQDLLKKSEASKVSVDLENRQIGENFRVLDPARIPVTPISPKRIQISAIGLAIGFGLAIAIAVLLEFKDSSFRNEAEVMGLLDIHVLASVPYVVTESERKQRKWRRLAVAAAAVVATTGAAYVFWTLRLWTVVV
jgi:protein tyrosine kinase modulator